MYEHSAEVISRVGISSYATYAGTKSPTQMTKMVAFMHPIMLDGTDAW